MDTSIDKVEEKPKKSSWSKTIRKGDNRLTVDVEELDNGGYLVSKDKTYKVGEEYKYENTKEFSDKNPLDEDETEDFEKNEEENEKNDMFNFLSSGGKPKFNLLPK